MAREWGLDWTLDTLVNESLIPRGRNALVARALMNPRSTHVFFLDADIGFDPEDVLALLVEDVDFIGGGYPKKSLPIDYVVNPSLTGDSDENKAEVDRIGTGFLLLKRSVFERIAQANPDLKYSDDCGLDASINEHLYAFFEAGLFGHGVFMSEDWLFCNRWRQLGGKIFISKRFALTHVGTFSFSESTQSALLSRITPIPSMAQSLEPEINTTRNIESQSGEPQAPPRRRRSQSVSKAKEKANEKNTGGSCETR